LPGVERLYRLFDVFNWSYFRGKLPRVTIEYSGRMMSAGSYIPHKKLIRIGRKYHEIYPSEITDTLKHEMIHIKHFNHDAAFKAEADRIGASVRARSHPLLRKPPRYVYVCPNCRSQFPRQRRFRMASCGYCTTGRDFDPRFKLRLLNGRKPASQLT
jgi:predicted SprT family Zn-dependent metalloprotease